ncbi:MAG: nucleotidyltransferase domain-containing protein [bacterium]
MEEKYYQLSEDKKRTIKKILKEKIEVILGLQFAYLHGSFLKADKFRDIDLAFYLDIIPPSVIEFELRLEVDFNEIIHYPVDVRILNNAPLSFRYNVIKYGEAIVVMNDDLRAEFEEIAVINYLDFAYFRKMYLKEVLGVGI